MFLSLSLKGIDTFIHVGVIKIEKCEKLMTKRAENPRCIEARVIWLKMDLLFIDTRRWTVSALYRVSYEA